MFTRYKGTVVPENYSGVLFRDAYAPPTEMKTHKPSPSYTSTRTSVSPAFKTAQLQRAQDNVDQGSWSENNGGYIFDDGDFQSSNENLRNESVQLAEQEEFLSDKSTQDIAQSKSGQEDGANLGARKREGDRKIVVEPYEIERKLDVGVSENEQKSGTIVCENGVSGRENGTSERESGTQRRDEKKEAHAQNFGAELSELINKVLRSIQSEDFLLLAVIFLILGDEKSEAKEALFPLALLLLYS